MKPNEFKINGAVLVKYDFFTLQEIGYRGEKVPLEKRWIEPLVTIPKDDPQLKDICLKAKKVAKDIYEGHPNALKEIDKKISGPTSFSWKIKIGGRDSDDNEIDTALFTPQTRKPPLCFHREKPIDPKEITVCSKVDLICSFGPNQDMAKFFDDDDLSKSKPGLKLYVSAVNVLELGGASAEDYANAFGFELQKDNPFDAPSSDAGYQEDDEIPF